MQKINRTRLAVMMGATMGLALGIPGTAEAGTSLAPFLDTRSPADRGIDVERQAPTTGDMMDYDDDLVTGFGTAITFGGGLHDMTTRDGEDPLELGGNWVARAIVGTRSYIAGELAYFGAANSVDDELQDTIPTTTALLQNGGEVALRLNLPIELGRDGEGLFEPFGIIGANVSSYNVVGEEGVASNSQTFVDESEARFALPVGGGLAGSYEQVFFDARVTYRPVFDQSILAGDDDALNSLAWTGSIGYEF